MRPRLLRGPTCSIGLTLLLLAGCGAEPAPTTKSAELGERVALAYTLADGRNPDRRVALGELAGERATVLMAWSVACPCIEAVEARVRRLLERFSKERGVAWIGIGGEPADTREQVREKLLRLGSPYPLLLDSDRSVCRRLGLTTATQVAILDAQGRLVYRGALDDSLAVGEGEHVVSVLDALLAGRAPEIAERPMPYGCEFDDPQSASRLR